MKFHAPDPNSAEAVNMSDDNSDGSISTDGGTPPHYTAYVNPYLETCEGRSDRDEDGVVLYLRKQSDELEVIEEEVEEDDDEEEDAVYEMRNPFRPQFRSFSPPYRGFNSSHGSFNPPSLGFSSRSAITDRQINAMNSRITDEEIRRQVNIVIQAIADANPDPSFNSNENALMDTSEENANLNIIDRNSDNTNPFLFDC